MDYYSNEPFITNFAARVLLATGLAERTAVDKRLWKLPMSDLWALSITICGWCPAKLLTPAQVRAVEKAFGDTGLSEFYPALDFFAGLLSPFAGAALASQSRPELEQAAVYLDVAIERIGYEVLSGAIASSRFKRVARELLAKFPLPPDLVQEYRAVVERRAADPSPAPARKSGRGDRFERADLRRDRTIQPIPRLSQSEELAANLYLRGYTVEEIEAIKRGPKRS